MVDIKPFAALQKFTGKGISDISKFICPPYDVISPEKRASLIRLSPNNAVQVELPGGEGDLKYLQASNILRKWKKMGDLQLDPALSFYLLETTFLVEDPFAPTAPLKRYGILAALRLEVPGKGAVRPHERTLPKAKEDRLKLLASVQTNISPIFGLFFDRKNEWRRWVASATRQRPVAAAEEGKDLSHRLWKIKIPSLQKKLGKILRKKDLYIADGHHRYEVSWAYQEMQLKINPSADVSAGWRHVMTYICPMEEPGLLMLPTHRLVKSKKGYEGWMRHLFPVFDVNAVQNEEDLISLLIQSNPKTHLIGWIFGGKSFLLKPKKGISMDRCLSHRPRALRSLDVILLHDFVLEECKGAKYVKDKDIFFTQDVKGMVQKTAADPSWTGFVLRSAGVESLARVASAGEVMPPKTTYFYPKVPTGFVLMPLNQKIT